MLLWCQVCYVQSYLYDCTPFSSEPSVEPMKSALTGNKASISVVGVAEFHAISNSWTNFTHMGISDISSVLVHTTVYMGKCTHPIPILYPQYMRNRSGFTMLWYVLTSWIILTLLGYPSYQERTCKFMFVCVGPPRKWFELTISWRNLIPWGIISNSLSLSLSFFLSQCIYKRHVRTQAPTISMLGLSGKIGRSTKK